MSAASSGSSLSAWQPMPSSLTPQPYADQVAPPRIATPQPTGPSVLYADQEAPSNILDDINEDCEEIVHMLSLGLKVVDVAQRLGMNRRSVYRILQRNGIERQRFTMTSDEELHAAIDDIKERHEDVGEVILNGHLRAQGIYVSRQRIRNYIRMVDQAGIIARRSVTIKRREYSVPCPNYVWHMDGNHSCIRWKLVYHGAMDGYSRLVTFMHCSPNNKSATVGELFSSATEQYGWPLRLRTDYGGENVIAWSQIREHWQRDSAVITGSSCKNERIERHWREMNRRIGHKFARKFRQLEDSGHLNPDNDTDLYCLHAVYLPLINQQVREEVASHNHHSISSEGNFTPTQLFYLNLHLYEMQREPMLSPPENREDDEQEYTSSNRRPHVQVDRPRVNLPAELEQRVQNIVSSSPITLRNAAGRYLQVVDAIGEFYSGQLAL